MQFEAARCSLKMIQFIQLAKFHRFEDIPLEILRMNPGFDRFQKSSDASKNGDSRNIEGFIAGGSAVLPAGVSLESCV